MIGLGPNWMIVTMNGLGPKSLLGVDISETTTQSFLCFLLGRQGHGGLLVPINGLVL